jgi:hypothetical protein
MTKIVLFFWILGPQGGIDRLEIENFYDMGACRAAAVSLTEPNPADGWSPLTIARCVEIPK